MTLGRKFGHRDSRWSWFVPILGKNAICMQHAARPLLVDDARPSFFLFFGLVRPFTAVSRKDRHRILLAIACGSRLAAHYSSNPPPCRATTPLYVLEYIPSGTCAVPDAVISRAPSVTLPRILVQHLLSHPFLFFSFCFGASDVPEFNLEGGSASHCGAPGCAFRAHSRIAGW